MEMGIDRILFAVDWPFVPNPPGTKWMEGVPLCDEDKAKILSRNAKRLLKMNHVRLRFAFSLPRLGSTLDKLVSVAA